MIESCLQPQNMDIYNHEANDLLDIELGQEIEELSDEEDEPLPAKQQEEEKKSDEIVHVD